VALLQFLLFRQAARALQPALLAAFYESFRFLFHAFLLDESGLFCKMKPVADVVVSTVFSGSVWIRPPLFQILVSFSAALFPSFSCKFFFFLKIMLWTHFFFVIVVLLGSTSPPHRPETPPFSYVAFDRFPFFRSELKPFFLRPRP